MIPRSLSPRILTLVLVGIVFISGCTQQPKNIEGYQRAEIEGTKAPRFQPTQTEFSDEEIIDAVYSEYKYPESFYQEELGGIRLFYENTFTLKPLGERDGWVELCTDNRSRASEWVETSTKNSVYLSRYKNLTYDERETEKFFEFRGIRPKDQQHVILRRVHKCSYFRPRHDKHRKLERGEVLGIFGQRPITIDNVKELIEYLWFIENYNFYGRKVLSSFTSDEGSSIKHTIYETKVVVGDWGLCDEISLVRTEYVVDRNSGEVTVFPETIKILEGECH